MALGGHGRGWDGTMFGYESSSLPCVEAIGIRAIRILHLSGR